jgi:hypothetical protein
VIDPLALPQVAFIDVVFNAVIGGVLAILAEIVNVHPKLFVSVIIGLLDGKPVTV